MLIQSRVKVIPEKSYHKILYLYPAINDTFVFLGMLGLRQDCVTHMDKQGNVLFQHVFQKPMDAFGMMSQNEAIMLETRGNCITMLNLTTHEFKRTPHHFFNEESDQANIHTFSDTKYVCIEELGRYNDNRFKLSYYNYPIGPKDKPFNVYQAKDNEWTYEYLVKKANQHSMMAWFMPRQDDSWEFRRYQLRDDPNGSYKTYKYPQKVGIPYGISNVDLAVNTMWETTKDCFMFVCISSKGDKETNPELGVIQNNYICDTKTSEIREAKFSFGQSHDFLIDYYNIGSFCMFRTYSFEAGKSMPSPVYYLDNQTEKIIAEQKWECSYLHKYEFPGYDGNMLIQNLYENGDCGWFECITKKMVDFKCLTLHFLLSLHKELDQDLLEDVMELLDFDCGPKVKI